MKIKETKNIAEAVNEGEAKKNFVLEETEIKNPSNIPHNAGNLHPTPGMTNFYIPISIVVAGFLIASAVFFSNVYKVRVSLTNSQQPTTAGQVAQKQQAQDANLIELAKKMDPISASDQIFGSKNAKVFLVEYSDYDCPWSKKNHETIGQLIAKYGSEKVAWVYRQHPIVELHPNAPTKSQAAECVSKYAGNDMFWKFSQELFQNQQELQTQDQLTALAKKYGVKSADFNSCMNNKETEQAVNNEIQSALNIGARGTPFTMIVSEKGNIPVSGAASFQNFSSQIDPLLK